jgi:phospho-N-acetylmuramoyl-pentapeptide-transferase
LIIPLSIFVFVATTNCVNLTDGLDGLAGGVSVVYLACMAFIVLLQNEWDVNGMVVLSASLIGGLLGFLVFNVNKASVFMGDTGSLALGGFIASISMISENVLFIPVVGVMFVITGISAIAQVLYYKKTKRRIFLMAPLHHHFQMKGFTEAKIAYVYKLVTLFAGLFCVFTLI